MAISCQDVSARMMELLYGELPGQERATLEEHLASCASCRAGLAALQGTRASARRALDADQPPPRAHQAILRAAAAAVAAKQPQPMEARAATPRPSFWERWRARWTLPTFATVGAVAVVVLASKVFLEPEKTVELGRQAVQSAPAEAPATPPVVAEPPATGGVDIDEKKLHATPAEKERKGEERDQLQPSVANNAPPRSSAAPATAQRRRAAPDGFGALGGLSKGARAAGSGRARAQTSDGFSFGDDSAGAPPGGPGPSKREFAPPPPLAEPARPSAPAANQEKARDTEGEALDEGAAAPHGNVGRLAGGAGPPPAPARAKAKKVEMPLEMPSATADLDRGPAPAAPAPPPPRAAPRAASESTADKAEKKSVSRAESKPAAESPVARADRLFAQGQWAAAARAYRELLRGDPNNGDAARWRQRLAAAEEAASAQAPAAAPAAAPGRR